MLSKSAVAVLVVSFAVLAFGANSASAATLTYSKGWHLVSGPAGTVFSGAADPMYGLDPDGAFTPVRAGRPADAGEGYYAYFNDLSLVRMGADDHRTLTLQVPAGVWTLVGNPSAYSFATIAGADVAYVYDQQGGYLIQSSVPPGQGALVYSRDGGTVSVEPNPAGIDATLSVQEEKLLNLALTPADLPASFAMTRADTNGGNNANVPVTFVQEFRPRSNPKPADAQQTTFLQANLQQTKDIAYATLLLNGTTADQVKLVYGANAKSITSVPPPNVGDAAVMYQVQIVNGNNQIGSYFLAFRTQQVFVTIYGLAPLNREDTALQTSLAQALDARIRPAFSVPPAAPTVVHANTVNATSIRVDWTRTSDNESGFGIVDSGTGAMAGTVVDNTTVYAVTGLQPNTKYCFAVFAYNAFGRSELSDSACATTNKS